MDSEVQVGNMIKYICLIGLIGLLTTSCSTPYEYDPFLINVSSIPYDDNDRSIYMKDVIRDEAISLPRYYGTSNKLAYDWCNIYEIVGIVDDQHLEIAYRIDCMSSNNIDRFSNESIRILKVDKFNSNGYYEIEYMDKYSGSSKFLLLRSPSENLIKWLDFFKFREIK